MTIDTTPLNLPFFKINKFNRGQGFIYDMDEITQDIPNFNLDSFAIHYEDIFMSTYLLLQLMGYRLEETRLLYEIGDLRKYIVVNHDTMELTTEAYTTESGSFSIKATAIPGCAIPLEFNSPTELALFASVYTQYDIQLADLSISYNEESSKLNIVSSYDNNDTITFNDFLSKINDILYYLMFFKLNMRIALGYIAEFGTENLEDDNEENRKLEQISEFYEAEVISPNSTLPSGLLWILNTSYWSFDLANDNDGALFREEAGKIWHRFFSGMSLEFDRFGALDSFFDFFDNPLASIATDSLIPGLSFGIDISEYIMDYSSDVYSVLKQTLDRSTLFMAEDSNWFIRIFTPKEKRAKFISSIKEMIDSSSAEMPDYILWHMDQLSYFETILTLVNFGVIEVPLPEFEIMSLENTRAPFYFYYKYMSGPHFETEDDVIGIDFYLYDFKISVEQEQYLYNHDTDNYFTPKDCFTWEYREPTEDRLATLMIVAAPGVSISGLNGLPQTCQVLIYRVQDAAYVSEWYEPIDIHTCHQPQYSASNVLLHPNGQKYIPYDNDIPEISSNENIVIEEQMHYMPVDMEMAIKNVPDNMKESFGISEDQPPPTSDKFPAFYIKPKYINDSIVGITISCPVVPKVVGSQDEPYFLEVEILVDPHSSNQRFGYYIDKIHDNWVAAETLRAQELANVEERGHFTLGEVFHLNYPDKGFEMYKLIVHFTPGVTVNVRENYRGIYQYAHQQPYGTNINRAKSWARSFFYETKAPNGETDHINSIPPEGYYLEHDMEKHFYDKKERVLTGDNPSEVFEGSAIESLNIYNAEQINAIEDISYSLTDTDISEPLELAKLRGTAVFTTNINYNGIQEVTLDVILFRLYIDLAIGFIPFVGDAVDIADFAISIVTGKDKWGEPVTEVDLAIMGVAALLPFASSGFVKNLVKHGGNL